MKIHIDEVDVESSVFDSLRISASPPKICSQMPVQLMLIAKKKKKNSANQVLMSDGESSLPNFNLTLLEVDA